MAPNSSDVFVLFVSFRQISFCVFLKKIFATRLRKQTKRVMDPSLLKTKNLHEVKHWIEPGTYVRPYHILEIFCIKLHWIVNDTFQSFTKSPTDFSSILILSLELVSYGWGQWNLDEEARWLSHLHQFQIKTF